MRMPVRRGLGDGRLDFRPGRAPLALQGQRAQDFPPGLNHREVGRLRGRADARPAGMRQPEEQPVRGAMRTQVIQDGRDACSLGWYPVLNLFEQVHPIRERTATLPRRERFARCGTERPAAVALATTAVIKLLRYAWDRLPRWLLHRLPSGETLCAFWPHFRLLRNFAVDGAAQKRRQSRVRRRPEGRAGRSDQCWTALRLETAMARSIGAVCANWSGFSSERVVCTPFAWHSRSA